MTQFQRFVGQMISHLILKILWCTEEFIVDLITTSYLRPVAPKQVHITIPLHTLLHGSLWHSVKYRRYKRQKENMTLMTISTLEETFFGTFVYMGIWVT